MIPPELEAKILRLHRAEHWPIGTIARELSIHHGVVARVIRRGGLPRVVRVRASKLDPFVPFLREMLAKHPKLRASRLWRMCRERGYRGSQSYFRRFIRSLRPTKPAEAFLKLSTLPGEQAQVDWAHFGETLVEGGTRKLYAFVMTLSFSRRIFLSFFLGQETANFLAGHQEAFHAFGAVPRILLYDNLKSCVIERFGDAIRLNDQMLAFARHYSFEPRAVAIARGNEKGRVERSIRYVRDAFFAARKWQGLEDLNRQALLWCEEEALERRCPGDRTLTVQEAFQRERPHLLALPSAPFPVEERVDVWVSKTPYVRFDQNDYSVPHACVRRMLVVFASRSSVRILDGPKLVAVHCRSFGKALRIEDPAHIEKLVAEKRHAREKRGFTQLFCAAPTVQKLLAHLAERGENLGSATKHFLRLLAQYGKEALERASRAALDQGVFHPHAVRHLLERERRGKEPPPLPVVLPEKLGQIVVRSHPLEVYDALSCTEEDHGERSDEQD